MTESAQMYVAGEWCGGGAGTTDVLNPSTGQVFGSVAMADRADLDRALAAAEAAFAGWARTSAYERSAMLRKAGDLLRERAAEIGRLMTIEQGKPVGEAVGEVMGSADHIDWAAEEGRRIYGRVIPSRAPNVSQIAHKVPLGVVAGFSPWNFPVSQAVRKMAVSQTFVRV